MKVVFGQDLLVGVVVAGADVEARVGRVQTLKQQTVLRVERALTVRLRKKRQEFCVRLLSKSTNKYTKNSKWMAKNP